MLKLLFVVPEYGRDVRGGIATYYAQLLPALAKSGADVRVHVTAERPPHFENIDGVSVSWLEREAIARGMAALEGLDALPVMQNALGRAYAAWEACSRGGGFDVVEVTDFGLCFVPWLASAGGPSVVVQLHGSGGQISQHDPYMGEGLSGLMGRLLETALLGRADELQSCGALNAVEWRNRLNRPVEHIWPAWAGTDFAPVTLPSHLNLSHAAVAIGRMQKWKGPEILCKALALLDDKAPRVVWIGSDHPHGSRGSSVANYLASTYPSVWNKSLVPAGAFPREAVAGILKLARFAVVPSVWDTFSLSTVEAMWAGKTVLCSEGAGAAGLIEPGVDGFRCRGDDAEQLAAALADVAKRPQAELDAIGARARAKVERKLSVEAIVRERLDHFNRLAGSGSGRKAPLWDEPLGRVEGQSTPFNILEQIPLRALVKHAAKRTVGKMCGALR